MVRILLMTVGTGIKGKEEESMDSQGHGIAYAIKEVSPDKIIFLVTETSEKTLNYVEEYLNEDLKPIFLKNEKIRISSYSKINKIIEEISDIFEKNKNNTWIVIPTFGTKAMSIGLSVAGVIYNAEIKSIEGERENNIVKKGTEELRSQNLWYLKNVFIIEKIKESFRSYKFSSALDKLEEITQTSGFEEKYIDLKNIIKAYISWDMFDHKIAFLKLKEFKNKRKYKIDKNFKFLEDLYNLREMIKKEKEEYKKAIGNEKIKLEEIIKNLKVKELLYLIFDLYSNALRRLEEKKYDDCMARLYRIFEFIAQFILWRNYNISVSNMFEKNLDDEISNNYQENISSCDEVFYDCPKIREKYNNMEEFKNKYCVDEKLKMGLKKCYDLLSDLGDDFGNYIKEIEKILFQRNNSILAHGIRPIKENSCNEAKEKVEKLLRKLCEMERYDFDELMRMSCFIKEL